MVELYLLLHVCIHTCCVAESLPLKFNRRRVVCSVHREPAIPGMNSAFCIQITDCVLDHTVLLVVMRIPVNHS